MGAKTIIVKYPGLCKNCSYYELWIGDYDHSFGIIPKAHICHYSHVTDANPDGTCDEWSPSLDHLQSLLDDQEGGA